MSVRQIRINSAASIKARIGEFRGKAIQVVLENSTAMFGILTHHDEDGITLENRRMKKTRYSYHEISEIYFDQVI